MSYTQTTDANGHEEPLLPGNRSSTASGGGSSATTSSLPGVASVGATKAGQAESGPSLEGTHLISRSTNQSTQQHVKTITKTIVSRETRFVGPDGRAIDMESYEAMNGHPSAGYSGVEYSNTSNNYSNGQRHGDFEYQNYQDYPISPPTPPSIMSESPPPLRRDAGQQSQQAVTHHQPQSGYDELDATLGYNRMAAHFVDPNNPYGYVGVPAQPVYGMYSAPPAHHQNEPQGFLDNRPSFDEHAVYSGSMTGDPALFMGPSAVNDVRWRNPDLHEVIEFLSHPEAVVRANAAAYLQHLCFSDDAKKQKTRVLGGIPLLVGLLSQDIPEVQKHACGALRNLSYGRKNDENKRTIRNAGGIPALVRLLQTQPDHHDLLELVTGILWNLSSCEDLKRPILDECLVILVKQVIIPCSRWDTNASLNPLLATMNGPLIHSQSQPLYWSNLFKNASGVLRNISSAGEYARRRMRESEYFVESLIFLMRTAIAKNDMDNKSIENCICILRNLSYRCQEVVDPNYDSHPPTGGSPHHNSSLSPTSSSRASAILGSVGSKVDTLSCFGGSKKKGKDASLPTSSQSADHLVLATGNMTLRSASSTNHASGNNSALPRSKQLESIRGCDLLWQPEIVQPYLALLSGCSNPETLEAAAGAIQNLSACYWSASIEIRAAVRKEKGLPVLVELLRMEVDRVVCAVATALRNLAMDSRNKELIGKYAMKDLVSKLPNGNAQHDYGTSDDTIAAVLATLNEVIAKNADFAKSLLEAAGMERLSFIIKNKNNKFSPRVFKFTSQLLFNMWQHLELRDTYKKAGYKESHFIIRPATLSRNTSSAGTSANHNNTLSRPMSTQSGTRYEDRTLPRGGGRQYQAVAQRVCHAPRLEVTSVTRCLFLSPCPSQQPEELAMNDMSSAGQVGHAVVAHDHMMSPTDQHHHRPPLGVQVLPPGAVSSD